MKIELSNGEIIDRYIILRLKVKKIKSVNAKKELVKLDKIIHKINIKKTSRIYKNLVMVNEKLWDIEDEIRRLGKQEMFGARFIELAGNVYTCNDWRSELKKQINILTNSNLMEDKKYAGN